MLRLKKATDTPFISVVLPTYNRAHTILDAVQSVLDQSYKNLELIVVDDASKDDTLRLLRELQDPRVRLACFEHNQGANAARNYGIRLARGTFIALQDSDDKWLLNKLELQVRALSESGALICFSALKRSVRGRSRHTPGRAYGLSRGRNDFSRALLFGSFVSNQTLVVHRLCLQQQQFDEQLRRLQDWDLCLDLSSRFDFYFLDQPLVDVREGSDRISSGSQSYVSALEYILNKHLTAFEKVPQAYAASYLNAAAHCLQMFDFLRCLKNVGRAVDIGVLAAISGLLSVTVRALRK